MCAEKHGISKCVSIDLEISRQERCQRIILELSKLSQN